MCINISVFASVIRPADSTQCVTDKRHEVSTSEGYISTTVADNGWGTMNCPWKIIAQPGQTINITAIDFHPLTSQQNCQRLGLVKDTQSKKKKEICKNSQREQHVYMSSGHDIEITMDNDRTQLTPEAFLIHYKGNRTLIA